MTKNFFEVNNVDFNVGNKTKVKYKIEEMKWIEMPQDLKLFAYDFCILNGFVFTGVGSK